MGYRANLGGDMKQGWTPTWLNLVINESSVCGYCCCLGLARITEKLFGLDRVKDKYLE